MILKYANYNEEYDDNLLPESINDLILTLIETEWEEIILTVLNKEKFQIKNNEDDELIFEEDYLKYINDTKIEYIDYLSINRITLKLKKESFNEDDWIGNRIIF